MDNKTILSIVNSCPDYAAQCLNSLSRGKCFVVGNSERFENVFKTRKSAERYAKENGSQSYYDENFCEMSTTSNLWVEEVKAEEILDPSVNKQIWYTYLKEIENYYYMYDYTINIAKRIITDAELLAYVLESLEESKKGNEIPVIAEYETYEVCEDLEEIENNNVIDVFAAKRQEQLKDEELNKYKDQFINEFMPYMTDEDSRLLLNCKDDGERQQALFVVFQRVTERQIKTLISDHEKNAKHEYINNLRSSREGNVISLFN